MSADLATLLYRLQRGLEALPSEVADKFVCSWLGDLRVVEDRVASMGSTHTDSGSQP